MVAKLKSRSKTRFCSFVYWPSGFGAQHEKKRRNCFERKNGMRQYIRIWLLLSSVCKSLLNISHIFLLNTSHIHKYRPTAEMCIHVPYTARKCNLYVIIEYEIEYKCFGEC